jgi:hypothetical protein
MSSDTSQPQGNGQVIPLRAAEESTEVRLGEGRGPAYVDVSDGTRPRKPVIPGHLRKGGGLAGLARGVRRYLHHRTAEHGHAALYHGVRSPRYVTLTLAWSVVGLFRIAGRILLWWHAVDLYQLEHQAAADGLLHDHLRIHKAGRESRTARGIILAVCAVVAIVAVVVARRYLPEWAWIAAALAAVPALAHHGKPAGKPIVTSAVLPAAVQPPTQDVITRALGSLGIAGIDKWLRDGRALVFPSPVREDGPGWRAEVDLPFGVTAEMVIERRAQLSAGLRRPLGAVWPEPVTREHAGRLELWVGRSDIAFARPPAWPLLKSGQCDVFRDIPFGTDVRGRQVKVPLIYHNWLIGAIPRQGKSNALRVLACAAALDPVAELWVHELKGSGDLDPLEKVAYRFVSGIHDEAIGYAAESLRLLRAEIERRADRLKALPRDVCPDRRVTREIAVKRSLRLWPIARIIDELQNLMGHPRFGKQAGTDAEFVIKVGPAFGVVLILATQRPDKASLPTGVRGNVSIRYCLKVMDHEARYRGVLHPEICLGGWSGPDERIGENPDPVPLLTPAACAVAQPQAAPHRLVWWGAVVFSSVSAVEDSGEANSNDHYRVIITRDGACWMGRTYGPYLPDDGVEARSQTLEGLKEEAGRQEFEAYWQAPRQAARGDGFARATAWSYEYDLGPGTNGNMEAFRPARLALYEAERDLAERGHELAADLAAAHNATLAEVADIMGICCAREAEEYLNYRGASLVAFMPCTHQERATATEPVAVRAAWRVRDLAGAAWGQLQAVRQRRGTRT